MSSKPHFITCSEYELNEKRKEGYEFVQVFYVPFICVEQALKEVPHYGPVTTYGAAPSVNTSAIYVTEQIPVVKQEPRFLMKLNEKAEVLFGD